MYMRNMLTETSSKHFFERLYYADYPAEGVTPLTIICTFAAEKVSILLTHNNYDYEKVLIICPNGRIVMFLQ